MLVSSVIPKSGVPGGQINAVDGPSDIDSKQEDPVAAALVKDVVVDRRAVSGRVKVSGVLGLGAGRTRIEHQVVTPRVDHSGRTLEGLRPGDRADAADGAIGGVENLQLVAFQDAAWRIVDDLAVGAARNHLVDRRRYRIDRDGIIGHALEAGIADGDRSAIVLEVGAVRVGRDHARAAGGNRDIQMIDQQRPGVVAEGSGETSGGVKRHMGERHGIAQRREDPVIGMPRHVGEPVAGNDRWIRRIGEPPGRPWAYAWTFRPMQ